MPPLPAKDPSQTSGSKKKEKKGADIPLKILSVSVPRGFFAVRKSKSTLGVGNNALSALCHQPIKSYSNSWCQ